MSATSQYNEGYKHMQETLAIVYKRVTGDNFDFTTRTFYSFAKDMKDYGSSGFSLDLKDNCSKEYARGIMCAISDLQEAVDMVKKEAHAEIIRSVEINF